MIILAAEQVDVAPPLGYEARPKRLPLRHWRSSKPPAGYGVDPGHPLAQGLMGFWTMNEGGGTLVQSAFGFPNTAVFGGTPPNWRPGATGPCLNLAGAASCNPSNPDLLNSLFCTWMCCFRTSDTSGFRALLGRQFTSTHGWVMNVNGADSLGLRVDTTTPNQTTTLAGGVRDGKTHIACITINGGSQAVIYMDGARRSASRGVAGTFTPGGGTASFGAGIVGSNFYIGALEWVAVWGRVLTHDQIEWMNAAPFAMFTSANHGRGLIGYNPLIPSPSWPAVTGKAWDPVVTEMSAAPELVKQSTETITLPFDFTTKMRAGDSVAVVNHVDADPGIVVSSPSLVGNEVTVKVSGGTAYTGAGRINTPADVAAAPTYWVWCNVNTIQGDVLELDCLIRIDDHAN